VIVAAEAAGLACRGTIESPITGADGNIELLAAFRLGRAPAGNR
jgi:predicted rRNA methylase YqxC with S4 and FtsJ domains